MRFFNSMQKNMSFADVVASIKYFIKANPDSEYRLAIGTDSQVKGKYTCLQPESMYIGSVMEHGAV